MQKVLALIGLVAMLALGAPAAAQTESRRAMSAR
jgi:hypothetical protein